MAEISRLTEAHSRQQRTLREQVARVVAQYFLSLPNHDQSGLLRFLAEAVPFILAAQSQSVSLVDSFIASYLGLQPRGMDPTPSIGVAARNGTPLEKVYSRPFRDYWQDLDQGKPPEEALQTAEARVTSSADTDLILSQRSALDQAPDYFPGLYGYQRLAHPGACSFCHAVSGAYVKYASSSPLHPHCHCVLQPLDKPHPRARYLPDGTDLKANGYAIRQHGELGAVLADPNDQFMHQSEVPA